MSARQQFGGRAGAQFAPRFGAEPYGVIGRAFARGLDAVKSIERQSCAAKRDAVVGQSRVTADRRAARAVEFGEKGALGGQRDAGRRIEYWRKRLGQTRGVAPRRHRNSALSDRRQKFVRLQHGGGALL